MLRSCFVWLLMFAIPVCAQTEPETKPVNLDKLNTPADETDPAPMPDGLGLFYASNQAGTYGVYLSKRAALSSNWPAGKSVLQSKDYDQRSPFYFAPKNTLYFASNPIPDVKLKDLKNFDLKSKQAEFAPLPVIGISEKEDELHPFVTPGGKEFYFSRKTRDGWKLYVAQGPIPGLIGKAVAVGFPSGFHKATLSKDGLTMILEGPLDNDRVGLHRSRRAKVGDAWKLPEELPKINQTESKWGDGGPCLSADGSRLYFVSDRAGGKGGLDLWVMPMAGIK